MLHSLQLHLAAVTRRVHPSRVIVVVATVRHARCYSNIQALTQKIWAGAGAIAGDVAECCCARPAVSCQLVVVVVAIGPQLVRHPRDSVPGCD